MSPASTSAAPTAGSFWIEKLLRPFYKLEPGEGLTALLLTMNVFLLLAGYYGLKTVREALILTEGGAEVKAYAAAGQAVLLLFAVPAYGWLATRLARVQLIAAVSLFFAVNLLIFYALMKAGVGVGVPFYLWLGVFNLMIVAQFWAFANDVYKEEQGKRIFPLIGLGSSLGALVGARTAATLFQAIGTEGLILLACGALIASVAVVVVVNRRACDVCAVQTKISKEAPGDGNPFLLVVRNRYLLLIAALVVLLNIVNTGGEFLLSKLVLSEAAGHAANAVNPAEARQEFIGSFYGNYFAWVNAVGLVLQVFLVGRLFQWVGVRRSLFLLPAIALGGYAAIAIVPALITALVTKVGENATDYSVENTARQALFLDVDRDAKYQAKTVIDGFFVRVGDLLQAGVVWTGTQLAFGPRQFAFVNIVAVSATLMVVVALVRHRSRESQPS